MRLKDSKIVFEALADETRLRILNLLAEGELCVCDLMRVLKEPQSKTSRHLAYLRRSGLVESRRGGLWMYYSLSVTGAAALKAILGIWGGGRSEFNELKKDLGEFRKSKSRLVGCCQ